MPNLTLYSYYRSSASFRVRVVLELKKLPYQYKAVHLLQNGGEQYTPEYRKLNPSREVPTLVHNEHVIGQSMAIIQYLEALAPSPCLFPKDPYARALITQACEMVNSEMQPVHNLPVLQELERQAGFSEEKKSQWCQHWIRRGFESLENFVKPHAGKYLFGNQVSAADVFLVPQTFSAQRFDVGMDDYPTLKRVTSECMELEAFQKAMPARQPDAPKT